MNKIKLKIVKKEEVEKEFDVEFPIYRRHDYESCTIYTRILEDLSRVDITIKDNGDIEVEFENNYDLAGQTDTADEVLGFGDYALTEKEFHEALTRVIKTVCNIEWTMN